LKLAPVALLDFHTFVELPRATVCYLLREPAYAKEPLTHRTVVSQQKGCATGPDGHWCSGLPQLPVSSQMAKLSQQEQSLLHMHGLYYRGAS